MGQKNNLRFKASETLLGIETIQPVTPVVSAPGFKASETLLGIETRLQLEEGSIATDASKPLKPF